jgi:hypothetical protein
MYDSYWWFNMGLCFAILDELISVNEEFKVQGMDFCILICYIFCLINLKKKLYGMSINNPAGNDSIPAQFIKILFFLNFG